MGRLKRSAIWCEPHDRLKLIVKDSLSFSEILKTLGMRKVGSNTRILKRRLEQDNIDFSHIPLGKGSNKGRSLPKIQIPLKEILVEHSTYCRTHLKARLLKDGLLKRECEMCGLKEFWNGLPLVLVLDHRNGIWDDNRIDNLRLLCPNCNSQTETFSGKNLNKM